jgi:hypothetical protein
MVLSGRKTAEYVYGNMQMEAMVANLEVHSRYYLGGTEEKHEKQPRWLVCGSRFESDAP